MPVLSLNMQSKLLETLYLLMSFLLLILSHFGLSVGVHTDKEKIFQL